jgi:hypothetical protein
VCQADPSWVELVLIGGDLAYARTDWFTTLAAQPTGPTTEHLTAWGKPMTLDTGYHSPTDDPTPIDPAPPNSSTPTPLSGQSSPKPQARDRPRSKTELKRLMRGHGRVLEPDRVVPLVNPAAH